MKMKAAIIHEAGAPFAFETVDIMDPQAGEVMVKVTACGVCATDQAAREQIFKVPLPAVLGHEGCGVIEKVGPGVTEFCVGDKVGFSYGSCGKCPNCRKGRPYGCYEFANNFKGTMPDGTTRISLNGKKVSSFFGQAAFAEYAVINTNSVIAVPDGINLATVGPLGCGIQTGAGAVMNVLKPEPDSSIIVTGCGPVGMAAIMAAKIVGCTIIIACDIVESRLELAKEFGATHVINSKACDKSVHEIAFEITEGGCDYSVDCTAIGPCIKESLECLRPLGKCANIGGALELNLSAEDDLVRFGRSLIGVTEGYSIPKIFIPQLLNYYKKGMFPYDKMITYYDFEQLDKAFEDTKAGIAMKAVVKM